MFICVANVLLFPCRKYGIALLEMNKAINATVMPARNNACALNNENDKTAIHVVESRE